MAGGDIEHRVLLFVFCTESGLWWEGSKGRGVQGLQTAGEAAMSGSGQIERCDSDGETDRDSAREVLCKVCVLFRALPGR
jgi:hypothetical protein